MQQAAENMQQAQQEQAQQHQAAAEQALQQAMEAFEKAQGQPEQGQPEQGQPEQGQPEQGQPTEQPMPHVGPTLQTMDKERGLGDKTDPAGKDVARTDAKWQSLGDRKRDDLFQVYARELPIEYREILEGYYEALSKDASSKKPASKR